MKPSAPAAVHDTKIDAKTDLLVDIISEVVTKVGPGSGPLYRMTIHNGSAELVRALDIPGIGRHGVEQSFSAGDLVRYGLDGGVRTDMVLRDGRGPPRAHSCGLGYQNW